MRFVIAYAANLSILIGGQFVSAQIRLKLPWGNRLGPEYEPQPIAFFGVLISALLAAYGISWLCEQLPILRRVLAPRRRFRVLVLSIGLTALGARFLVPDYSKLQLVYFAVTSVLIGGVVIGVVGRFGHRHSQDEFFAQIRRLIAHRYLLSLWLRYNIETRYSQTLLGILWIILLPISTSLVLAFAFQQIMQSKSDVPFVSFLLSGVVLWNLFNAGVQTGSGTLIGRMSLMQQVNFPRETVVLLALGEVFVDMCFTFVALLVINALNGITPNIYFVYLPLLLLILCTFTLGLMFIVSCLGLMIRDIPQLVGVLLQLGFWITPIVYPVSQIPDRLKWLVLVNPMALVIQAFRDVLVYARPPDLLNLCYPLVMALTLLYVGYAFFKANEERLTDFS